LVSVVVEIAPYGTPPRYPWHYRPERQATVRAVAGFPDRACQISAFIGGPQPIADDDTLAMLFQSGNQIRADNPAAPVTMIIRGFSIDIFITHLTRH